jgi:hypothetical protein
LTFRKKHQVKVTTCSTVVALFFTCIVACTKSDNPSYAGFAGKWELTGYQGTLSSDVAYQRNDTTIEQIEYQTSVSTASGGYVSFTGNSFSSDSLFVNPQYTQKLTIYQNSVMVSDTTIIYTWPQNTLNVTSEFEIIGSDSINFNYRGIPLTGGPAPSGGSPGGAIFSFSGNTMTITSHIYQSASTSSTSFGRDYQSYIMTFVKK